MMKYVFKIKVFGFEGESEIIHFLSEKNRKNFEKDYLQCILESKKDDGLVSKENHFNNIRDMMVKKGYEEVWVSDVEYRLDDNCPTPNSTKLLIKSESWLPVRHD